MKNVLLNSFFGSRLGVFAEKIYFYPQTTTGVNGLTTTGTIRGRITRGTGGAKKIWQGLTTGGVFINRIFTATVATAPATLEIRLDSVDGLAVPSNEFSSFRVTRDGVAFTFNFSAADSESSGADFRQWVYNTPGEVIKMSTAELPHLIELIP